jgi:hypothetical protein
MGPQSAPFGMTARSYEGMSGSLASRGIRLEFTRLFRGAVPANELTTEDTESTESAPAMQADHSFDD